MEFVNECVTYDDVAAAADDLMRRGEDPSLLGVREYFGLVSSNTVYIHLVRWRRDQPPINPPGPTVPKNVPSELADVVRQAMEHHATARVTELRAKLDQSYGEALGLARIGNRLEEDIEQLTFRAETAEAGIDKLLVKIDGEKRAEDAEAELAQAQEYIQHLENRLCGWSSLQ